MSQAPITGTTTSPLNGQPDPGDRRVNTPAVTLDPVEAATTEIEVEGAVVARVEAVVAAEIEAWPEPVTVTVPRTRRLHHVFEAACDRTPAAVALECEDEHLTYQELDVRANRLAHHLRTLGVREGVRVAILLRRSVETYVALLGIGKAGGAFVPIDPESPADRVAYITEDSAVGLLLTSTELADRADGLACTVVLADATPELAAAPGHRSEQRDDGTDPAAYVIYTSGSSGRPKGVEVGQASICNFLDVVPGLYDVRPDDRVYQGMTIAFDFSIEEIWPTWSVGATLIAGPNDSRRFGVELADFLEAARITVWYCVPTLLATIPRDLPRIRNLLVGGEACPGQLVERWSRPGRRILNTYGPTEATVTATWCELLPGRIVTIGVPLPTYSVVLLDEQRRLVADGEVGEICIGGPGVARGYVGRPELTADKFIEHALAPPGSRLYRTGDLGRLTENGEIEYLGRADAEVKIRGHRVDLGEIENVLLEDDGVAEAVAALVPVSAAEDAPRELAAYVVPPTVGEPDEALVPRLYDQLQERLPAYMVPGYLDVVTALPAMPSGKVDRKQLPFPVNRRPVRTGGEVVAADGEIEEEVRAVWAEAFNVEPSALSVEADFFNDLGGHSLLAARVVSSLRARAVGAGAAVRDLYSNPTIRGMAARLRAVAGQAGPAAPPRPEPLRHRSGRIAAAGVGQGLVIYLLLLLITLPVSYVYTWNNGRVSVEVLVQLMMAILVSYLGVRWIVPVVLARPMAAGIRPGRYRLWGPTYVRLWALNLLLAIGPMPVISGSPLMAMYLRLLGARVGRRTTIATSSISLPTLLRIGNNASIGYGVSMRPWRVEDGWVIVEPITVGEHAFVGANAVLEPGASVGPHACLGEQSVLEPGETVPPQARWSGSPPGPVEALSPTVETLLRAGAPARGWRLHHLVAAVLGLAGLELSAIAMIVPSVLLVWWALLQWGLLAGLIATIPAGPVYVLTTCAVVALGKRLVLRHAPAGVHPARSMLGVRKWIADKLLEFSLMFTNSLYSTLYTVPWLRLLGARVGRGAEVSTAAHLDPDLLTLGPESFVADMASVGATTFANGRMALLPTRVGSRAFVGNAAFVPAGTTLGDGSLVGVRTLPPDEDVPEGTSWLGSPAMHLPVRQSSGSFSEAETFRPPRKLVVQRLAVEFARATAPASLLGMSVYLYLWVLSVLARGRDLPIPALVSPFVVIAACVAVIVYCAATKRTVVGTYRPRVEPLWSPFVRRTEFVTGLYEAAAVPAGIGMLVGTPFLPPVLRWFGARIGRRTWIGTTYLTEFDLVEIGDDATVGAEVSLQTHLFEDRVMKMSVVTVGAGATVGNHAVVLYDAVVGDDVSLGSLSLLMKGERLTPGSRWRGIPAQGVGGHDVLPGVVAA
ncbi:amino acid adenylation domain-containing protein [Dactylosporangium fulvum]|uniref:Amino acid adenylation domain-containing protein n=1 Tax=Dactylosporangium fulvum TaxID=53359 RepID=A0ABY5W9T7_9ACTN|nr:Pls/PosA family non-ribosomal peptide synthetase [Dactylosporangium fulvum]UWP86322.1 amino acid adenylation domain-containing protein [Dactylosporangium fulvum]